MSLMINADRFKADFDALAQIGATGDGGVHRPTWSEPHLEAQRWWQARAAAAGLEIARDGAANCSAVWRAPDPNARTLLLGSHTDSVPNGGRFDGALGVMAALEVVRTIKESGAPMPVNLEVMDFADEEGTLVGLLGSSALAGYLELHIEQGPQLVRSAIPIGIVLGIVGITSLRLVYRGQANHAGTTPMTLRHDASLGAAAFTLTAREMVVRDYATCTINVGRIDLAPGAFNIIPGEARLALEFRSPEAVEQQRLETSLLGLADLIARQYSLSWEVEIVGLCAPARLGQAAQAAIAAAADSLALRHTPLPSGAGHDAQSLAPLTETGMIFIPSRAGVSHAPEEYSEWSHCVDGANVLLRAALTLAEG